MIAVRNQARQHFQPGHALSRSNRRKTAPAPSEPGTVELRVADAERWHARRPSRDRGRHLQMSKLDTRNKAIGLPSSLRSDPTACESVRPAAVSPPSACAEVFVPSRLNTDEPERIPSQIQSASCENRTRSESRCGFVTWLPHLQMLSRRTATLTVWRPTDKPSSEPLYVHWILDFIL